MKKLIVVLLCIIFSSCSKRVVLERQEVVYQYVEKDGNYRFDTLK